MACLSVVRIKGTWEAHNPPEPSWLQPQHRHTRRDPSRGDGLTGRTNPNLALEPGSRHHQFMASSPLQPSFAWRSSSSTDAINEQHLSGLDCSGAAQHAWAQHGAGRHSLGPETRQYPGRLIDGTDKAHFQPSAHPTRNKRRSNLNIIEVSCGVYCVYFEKIKLT